MEILAKYKGKKIIFCLPGDSYSRKFLSNILGLNTTLIRFNIKTSFSQSSGSSIHQLRDVCGGGNPLNGLYQTPFSSSGLDYDYLLWVDSDILFNRDSFERLLEADKDVVSGWYMDKDLNPAFGFTKTQKSEYKEKTLPLPLYDKDHLYSFHNDSDVEGKTQLYKIDWVGMGWILIKKGVMEQIKYPWFSPKLVRVLGRTPDDDAVISLSEDLSFQLSLKEAGIDIWLDPLARVGHEKVRVL